MKLKSLQINPDKGTCIDFVIVRENGSELTITLRERPWWPMLLGQPIELVEKWLFKTYLDDINFAMFGILT